MRTTLRTSRKAPRALRPLWIALALAPLGAASTAAALPSQIQLPQQCQAQVHKPFDECSASHVCCDGTAPSASKCGSTSSNDPGTPISYELDVSLDLKVISLGAKASYTTLSKSSVQDCDATSSSESTGSGSVYGGLGSNFSSSSPPLPKFWPFPLDLTIGGSFSKSHKSSSSSDMTEQPCCDGGPPSCGMPAALTSASEDSWQASLFGKRTFSTPGAGIAGAEASITVQGTGKHKDVSSSTTNAPAAVCGQPPPPTQSSSTTTMDTTAEVDITGEGKVRFFRATVTASLTVSGCYTYETSTTCDTSGCSSPPPKHLVGGQVQFNFSCGGQVLGYPDLPANGEPGEEQNNQGEFTLCSTNNGKLCVGFGILQTCTEMDSTIPWGDEGACG